MKINPDCIRDILIRIEQLGNNEIISQKEIFQELSMYENDEIQYHIRQLYMENLIIGRPITSQSLDIYPIYITDIYDLTPDGHKLLAAIKPKEFWENFKMAIPKFGFDTMLSFLTFARDNAFEQLKELFMQYFTK